MTAQMDISATCRQTVEFHTYKCNSVRPPNYYSLTKYLSKVWSIWL